MNDGFNNSSTSNKYISFLRNVQDSTDNANSLAQSKGSYLNEFHLI